MRRARNFRSCSTASWRRRRLRFCKARAGHAGPWEPCGADGRGARGVCAAAGCARGDPDGGDGTAGELRAVLVRAGRCDDDGEIEHQMLFDIAAGYLEMRAAVRGREGRAGSRDSWRRMRCSRCCRCRPRPRTGSAEPALVLALSRQESEFNHARHFWRRCARADADDPALCAGGGQAGGPAVQGELADG
jgi:hypothetical protein